MPPLASPIGGPAVYVPLDVSLCKTAPNRSVDRNWYVVVVAAIRGDHRYGGRLLSPSLSGGGEPHRFPVFGFRATRDDSLGMALTADQTLDLCKGCRRWFRYDWISHAVANRNPAIDLGDLSVAP